MKANTQIDDLFDKVVARLNASANEAREQIEKLTNVKKCQAQRYAQLTTRCESAETFQQRSYDLNEQSTKSMLEIVDEFYANEKSLGDSVLSQDDY